MNDDHGAKEMRFCLVVKLFLNMRVVHEDERALLKIMIMDGRGKTLDEFSSRLLPGLQDSGRHIMKVFWHFCNTWAQCAMRSSVEDRTSRGEEDM